MQEGCSAIVLEVQACNVTYCLCTNSCYTSIYIKQKCLSVCHVWGRGGREEGRGTRRKGRGREISQMDMMECLGGHEVTEFSN